MKSKTQMENGYKKKKQISRKRNEDPSNGAEEETKVKIFYGKK